jgi:hypothetical protein
MVQVPTAASWSVLVQVEQVAAGVVEDRIQPAVGHPGRLLDEHPLAAPTNALGMLGDVLRVRRWAMSGGYGRAVCQVPDTSPALGAELGRAAQPG